jgi:hypothetical protein
MSATRWETSGRGGRRRTGRFDASAVCRGGSATRLSGIGTEDGGEEALVRGRDVWTKRRVGWAAQPEYWNAIRGRCFLKRGDSSRMNLSRRLVVVLGRSTSRLVSSSIRKLIDELSILDERRIEEVRIPVLHFSSPVLSVVGRNEWVLHVQQQTIVNWRDSSSARAIELGLGVFLNSSGSLHRRA